MELQDKELEVWVLVLCLPHSIELWLQLLV